MNPRLKKAVAAEPAPPYLEARIRASLRSPSAGPRRPFSWWPAAAAAVLTLAVIGFFVDRYQENATVVAITQNVSGLLRVGLSDHLHCTILRKQRQTPTPLAALPQQLGRQYAPLVPVVQKHVPSGYRVLDAHRCDYQGREFMHLVMNQGSRFVSVVVVKREAGESFAAARLVPALAQSGIAFYQQGTGSYQVAGFESGQHLVYVISDLPPDQNQRLMLAMAGDLQAALPAL